MIEVCKLTISELGTALGQMQGERQPRNVVVVPRLLRPDVQKSGHASEQEPLDILKRREEWFAGQLDLDPPRLDFIDETWAATEMARQCGRAPKRERLRASTLTAIGK